MLGTAKADALCAKLSGLLRVGRGICVGTNLECTILVRPGHHAAELAGDGSVYGLDLALIDIAGGTVDGNVISLVELLAAQGELLVLFIHIDVAAAGYAALAHTAGYHCCVAGHTAANRQDTLCTLHSGDILRRCLQTNQDHLVALLSPLYSVIRREYDLAAGSARRCAQTLAQRRSRLQRSSVKLRMQQRV